MSAGARSSRPLTLTDDDREVDNDRVQESAAVFAQNSRVAIVYCIVVSDRLRADQICTFGHLRPVIDKLGSVGDEVSERSEDRRPQLLRPPMTSWP
jgi:hypothetical protein